MKLKSSSDPYCEVESVYIVEPANQGWIIERLMREIEVELNKRGVTTRFGQAATYGGEDVIFNSRFLVPLADSRARVSSLFITHVDDMIKEFELRSRAGRFNSLVCMSGQEADFVAGLVGDRTGVIGIDLPARDLTVVPIRLALFTACYEDGRKNEKWILDYFETKGREHKDNFVICLMGWGWEPFCAALGKMEMNYEIYRYSRFTPGEYGMYKTALASMDHLAYLGFDGGAMCVYDAVAAGVSVIATDISYHRGLGPAVSLVSGKEAFFEQMDRLHALNLSRNTALKARSVMAYVNTLLSHWNQVANAGRATPSKAPAPTTDQDRTAAATAAAEAAALELFRGHYKPIGLSRLRSFAIRFLQSLRTR